MNDSEVFLRQEIDSASPAKLRWLLIRKAHGLVNYCEELWKDQRHSEANQWFIKVRDIFEELLNGVTDRSNPAAAKVADLYVFLIKKCVDVEMKKDAAGLRSIREILDVELQTWDMYVRKELGSYSQSDSASGSYLGGSLMSEISISAGSSSSTLNLFA